jgi:putative peptidoglycan lipid II flippase
MKENSRVIKAAGVVGAATLLSRILGYIRDAVIAWYFGAGHSSDAFIAAFRIPNLLRKLFGEGAISNAFIPVLTDYLTRDGKDEGLRLARSALFVLSILLVALSILGVLLAPLIVKVIAPGFFDSPGKIPLTITLTRIMFPYIFFIGLVALCMGILNVFGHFAAPALAPVLLNVAIICAVIFICPYLSNPVMGLAIGVIIGGVLQLGLQLPFLIRKGLILRPKGKLFHPGLKKIGALMPPIILGGAVYQVNVLVGGLLGSLLQEGSVSYLYFADRLVQFPLGIFAIAAATAVLPSLSRQAARNDIDALKNTFGYALRLIIFLTIPSMVGLIILREPIVALLFQRGEFSSLATQLTAQALLYYAMGLGAFSAVKIVAGLALATSLASVLNLALLVHALRSKFGSLGWISIMRSAFRTLLSAGFMGVVVWGAVFVFIPPEGGGVIELLLGLIGCILTGLIVFGTCSYLIKSPELLSVVAEVKKGLSKK